MSLNKWECGKPGCRSTALGVGGAVGLRAVGWWFEAGQEPLCPVHRPDPTEARNGSAECGMKGPCRSCAADREADRLQAVVARELGLLELAEHAEHQFSRWSEPAGREDVRRGS